MLQNLIFNYKSDDVAVVVLVLRIFIPYANIQLTNCIFCNFNVAKISLFISILN